LRARLRRVVPSLTAVSARHVHWVASEEPLDEATAATVERLLTYGPPDAGDAQGAHVAVVVVAPRLGTLSPWASKATDIAHNCGVTAVKRIERGTAYYVGSEKTGVAALLHDRMTQTVLASFEDAAQLFVHVPPRP